MKKETIFRHELNESIQANAAMNCLKNRNNHKQLNETSEIDYAQLADDVCASYRGPLSKLDLKDSINYIVKMVAKKIGKTVDTLTPQELTAIQKAAKHSVWYVSEQEETDETSDFDAMFAYREDLRDMATPLTKKAYMIIRNEFGDSMWRQLGMDDCDYMGLIDMLNYSQKHFNITDPQDLADVELGRKSFRNFTNSHDEQEEMEVTDAKHALTQLAAELLHYDEGDLDDVYYAISDIIDSEGYSPQPDEYEMWIEEHVNEIEDLIM